MNVVEGFKNMSWFILGYDGMTEIYQRRIAADQVDEAGIRKILRELAMQHLTPEEIAASDRGDATFLTIRPDDRSNRLSFMIGENPHYVAGLFRADERA